MQTVSYYITYVVICFWSLSLSSVVVAGSGAGGRASIGGIKGACPAPLIAPQSALVDWGGGVSGRHLCQPTQPSAADQRERAIMTKKQASGEC